MRVGFISMALIIVVFAGAPGSLTSATQVTFAQSTQPRNQTQPQEGLSADKKKKLSTYSPDDVFGVPSERETNPNRGTIRQPRPLRTPPLPSSSPLRPPATFAPAPSATSSAPTLQPPVETPTPTMAAGAIDGGVQPLPLSQEDSSVNRWPAFALLALALIVSAALIFTITKLFEKIRETRSG